MSTHLPPADEATNCGPEHVWIVADRGGLPSRQQVVADLEGLADGRDRERTADNVLTLLGLSGSVVESWHADKAADISGLDWWGLSEDRVQFHTVTARRRGEDDFLIHQVTQDDFTALEAHTRPRPPGAQAGAAYSVEWLPEPGHVGRVAVVVHAHHQRLPYQQALCVQLIFDVEGHARLLMCVEGYDISEWELFDRCDAVRHPGDEGIWPF